MRRIFGILLSLTLAMTLAGCGGDSYDKIGADMVTNVQAVRDALVTVTDQATAKAAAEKITAQMDQKYAIKARLNALGKPTKEVGDDMNTKYKVQMDKASEEISKQVERISALGPEVIGPIQMALQHQPVH